MPAPSARSKRTTAAIVLLILGSLLSSARIIFKTPRSGHIESGSIATRSDQRFALLKARLPVDGVVGYIGSSGDSATPDYYLTQYALAPLVVDNSSDHAIVIGNFPSSQAPRTPQNLRLVEDFGNGVLLLAGEESK
jgi:hypothetical protein